MRYSRFVFGALVLGLALGACGDDSQPAPGETTTTSGATSTTVQPAQPTTTTSSGTAISARDGVLSDGLWAVGDAGTVEFGVRDDGLELIDAIANDGWRMSIDEESPDEIEVDFVRDNLDYQIEIQYENGILEIEIDLDIDPAEPGSFDIGPAGVAIVSVSGDDVVLDDLAVTDGWTVVEQDTDDGEVEIDLRKDNVDWEFRADFDDGRLEVEIDFEIEGRFP